MSGRSGNAILKRIIGLALGAVEWGVKTCIQDREV